MLIPVLLLGIIYAGLLYFRNPANKLSKVTSVFLFIIRFFVVSFIGFLLLSPTFRTKTKQVEKPVVVIGFDNSASVNLSKDSISPDRILADIKIISNSINEMADIESFLFGNKVRKLDQIDFSDELSDYSEFVKFIRQNYAGVNVGAMVLFGDGNYNIGIDPVYESSEINFPIFTVALGDTTKPKDIRIAEVRNNSIVYSGDDFPIEVTVNAVNMSGEKSKVTLLEGDKIIGTRSLGINSDNFHNTLSFTVKAEENGKRRFRIVVDQFDGENITGNNYHDIFVDVLESRLDILLLATAPHPDLGAIKQSLSHNPNFNIDIHYIGTGKLNINEYDVVVLYQIPSVLITTTQLLNDIEGNNVPALFITGKQSRYSAFNRYTKGLRINSSVGKLASSQYERNTNFSSFTFDNELVSQLEQLPPLFVPLANYQMIDGLDVLAWQKISDVVTDFPLIAYYNHIDSRRAMIMGEGIWMWRIQSFLKFGNTTALDALLSKTIMYLAAEKDKRRFKVISEGNYNSSGDIIINAELYNKSLERDNSNNVNIRLINDHKEEYDFIFTPYQDYYQLNINKLPVGLYSYVANVSLGDENFTEKDEFIVQQIDYENKDLTANHRILSRMSEMTYGDMYYPNEVEELSQRLSNLDLRSRVHYQDSFIGVNSLVYMMLILLLLMGFEWFVRKYLGNY